MPSPLDLATAAGSVWGQMMGLTNQVAELAKDSNNIGEVKKKEAEIQGLMNVFQILNNIQQLINNTISAVIKSGHEDRMASLQKI